MKPILFIICGNIGTGKTTTANYLSKIVKAPVVSVDQTINRIFENPSNKDKDIPFNEFELKICYNTFALITEHMLKSGNSIIVDGAFAKKKQRDLLISIAEKLKMPYYVLYVTCPDEIIKKRSSERFSKKEGVGWKAHLRLKKEYEPLNIIHEIIDTSKDVENQLKTFVKSFLT